MRTRNAMRQLLCVFLTGLAAGCATMMPTDTITYDGAKKEISAAARQPDRKSVV